MKIIILIIASHAEHYDKMINIWKKYMNNHPNITSFFIMNNENIPEDVIVEQDIMYVNSNETYVPGILHKTVKCIEYCLNNFEFDFIYRTNLSSFLVLDKLYDFININKSIDYGGVIGFYEGIYYSSGSGFFISKDTCKYLVDNESKLKIHLIDDIAIGELLIKKYEITPILRINTFEHENCDFNIFKNNYIFHFRCKFENRSEVTISTMNKLYDLFYK
jgi:hypothetical protein